MTEARRRFAAKSPGAPRGPEVATVGARQRLACLNGMCTTDKSQIARLVLSYLSENVGAQDTFEGIVEWWLLEQRVRQRAAEVREALADLSDRKLIVERTGRDARTRYRINRRKLKAIRALLEQPEGGGGV